MSRFVVAIDVAGLHSPVNENSAKTGWVIIFLTACVGFLASIFRVNSSIGQSAVARVKSAPWKSFAASTSMTVHLISLLQDDGNGSSR